MADLARKQLMITNPKKKRRKAHGKKRRAHRASRRRNPGKPHRRRARRRGHSAPRRSSRRRSSSRRRNPSFGHAALSTGAALAMGAGAAVVAQVAGHLLGEAAATADDPMPKLATGLRIGVPAALAVGAGLGVSMLNHTAGKAVAAGAGAVAALQATSAIAEKMGTSEDGGGNFLQKGGLQLLAGDEFTIRDGHVYQRRNGREQLLFGATPQGYARLRVNGGAAQRWPILGNLGQRGALVVNPDSNQMQVLSGYQFDGLQGYQTDNLE